MNILVIGGTRFFGKYLVKNLMHSHNVSIGTRGNVLDIIHTEKYILTSTTAVYDKTINTKEDDYNPFMSPVVWCDRDEFPYGKGKQEAERALFQKYPYIYLLMDSYLVSGSLS